MAVGLAKKNKIFYSAASGVGNPVIYVGAKTGKDGIHGATMASAEFSDDTQEKKPTVQVGDPFTGKLLLEACLELMETDSILSIQDMGAAGLTSSSVEMASKGKLGIHIDLDKIPLRNKEFLDNLKELKIFPIFVSDNFYKIQNNHIHFIGDAFFAFPPSFAQGASQSIEGAYDLFKSIENSTESNFFKNRVNKTKMVNFRSKLNQFVFHLSNPLTIFFRNIFLKRLVKNKKFLESYLGKVYRN